MYIGDLRLCMPQEANYNGNFLVSLPVLAPAPLRFLSLQHGDDLALLRQTPFTGALQGCLASQETRRP
jgi:hypothetical protein